MYGPKIWEIVPKEFKELDFSIPSKTQLKNGNLAIGLVDYVKYTFRMLVSCTLPTTFTSPPFLTPKQYQSLLRNEN